MRPQSFTFILAPLLLIGGVASAQTLAEPPAPLEPPTLQIAQSQPEQTRAERQAARHESRRPPTEEESLALAAMEGLMAQPPERALPVIKKVLAGQQSKLVKERALFVLSQIDQPEANAMLLDYARSANNPLRNEAIRMIGVGGNAKSLSGLQDIYAGGNASVKRSVLEAWLIAGRKAEVYQAALNAKSEADASQAIRTLGAMGAVDELRKLGDQNKNSRNLLEAYAITGDLNSLRKLADGASDLSVRSEAIRRIGIINSEPARVALRELYAGNTAPQLKDAVLEGMLISNDQQGVLALYRNAKTPEEKRTLLRTLSIMGGDAALQAIDAALETRK